MKDIAGNDLAGCIDQFADLIVQWGCSRSFWSTVAIVEEPVVFYKEAKCYIPRLALSTPEQYSDRFSDLLGCGYSWLNINAIGIIELTLIIKIEMPSYITGTKGKTSVNYSGRHLENGKAQWDAANYVILT